MSDVEPKLDVVVFCPACGKHLVTAEKDVGAKRLRVAEHRVIDDERCFGSGAIITWRKKIS